MENLKTLYNTAKTTRKLEDISKYIEAVDEILESRPIDFLSNLEYIITYGNNLSKLDKFIEKYGLSIVAYSPIMECLDMCIERCNSRNTDSSQYESYAGKLRNFRENHNNCFLMYDYYNEGNDSSYLKSYYGFTENGVQNNKLIKGMLETFKETAIPDLIITAESLGDTTLENTLNYLIKLESVGEIDHLTYNQWIYEACKDLSNNKKKDKKEKDKGFPTEIWESINTLDSVVSSILNREDNIIRESVIMGKSNPVVEYSEGDIDAINKLITFKEYMLCGVIDNSEAIKIQNEIYSLYERLEGIEEVDNSNIYESSGSHDKKLINEIKGRIIKLCRQMRSTSRKDYRRIIKEHNRKLGIFSPNKIMYPNINVSVGDDKGPFLLGKMLLNGKIEKLILDQDNSKWLDKFILYLIFEVDTAGPLSNTTKNRYINFYVDAMSEVLKTYISDGKISIDKKGIREMHLSNQQLNSLHKNSLQLEYVNVTYITVWNVPVFLSRDYVLGDSNSVVLTESIIEEINDIINEEEFVERSFKSIVNTRNKKTGDAPSYLSNNHDINYGETSDKKDDDEVTLDDFKRDSVKKKEEKERSTELDDHYDDVSDELGVPSSSDEKKKSDMQAINNYYYYTYNNSLNKNSNSFNKDIRDDHSTDKGIYHHIDNLDKSVDKGDNKNNSTTLHKESSFSINPWDITTPLDYPELLTEAVGDADDNKPESDHPVRDTLQDIDRRMTHKQQEAKKTVQDIQNVGRTFMKPAKRTQMWVTKMVSDWKDADETKVKERLADPRTRSNLFSAIKAAIAAGSLAKAGLLFNPIFLFLTVTRGIGKNKREFRIRNEMIGEIKTEIAILDEKIKDADGRDNAAKYKMMRLKNELEKKLLRVGGPISNKKWIKGKII